MPPAILLRPTAEVICNLGGWFPSHTDDPVKHMILFEGFLQPHEHAMPGSAGELLSPGVALKKWGWEMMAKNPSSLASR